jgi:valyl-tRNA synthetase
MALRVLVHALDTSLRLLHPFMPFATEEMWGYLPIDGEALIMARWPEVDERYIDDNVETSMNILMDLVRGVRETRKQYEVDAGLKIRAVAAPNTQRDNLTQYGYFFERLCNVKEVELLPEGATAPADSASVVVADATLYLPLAGMVDVEKECARLVSEREKLAEQIERSQKMLDNENFVNRARPDVVQRERDKLASLEASNDQLAERLAQLCG